MTLIPNNRWPGQMRVDHKTRRCPKCKQLKTRYGFTRSVDQVYCNQCLKRMGQVPPPSPPSQEAVRLQRLDAESALRVKYGIDFEDWAQIYELQNGRCRGCEKKLAFDRSTHVDHDHDSREIRGLLCDGCNVALGFAKDNPETLRRLADYLNKDYDYGAYDPSDPNVGLEEYLDGKIA